MLAGYVAVLHIHDRKYHILKLNLMGVLACYCETAWVSVYTASQITNLQH